MACSPERYANLPIAPHYKKSLIDFCNDPKNDAACAQLCESSDEEIVQSIGQIEGQLKEWQENGVPEEIKNTNPDLAAEVDSPLNSMKTADAPLMKQGIGELPSAPTNPEIPPGQLADVPMPMDVPPPPQSSTGAYRHGGFVNAPKFGIGGSIKKALGGSSGILGGIIGGALAVYTGGMSLVAGAALGAGAGNYIETRDLGSAAGAAVGAATVATGVGAATGFGGATATATNAAGNIGGNGFTASDVMKGVGKAGKLMAGEPPPQGVASIQAATPPTPGNPTPRPPVEIPGSTADEGIGSLPTLAPLSDPTQASFTPATAFPLRDDNRLGASQPLAAAPIAEPITDPMAEYYQCVMTQGAENCQMPQEAPQPAQPEQYAQNYVGGGAVDGMGTETSDEQPAWLSDNEFVMTADAVRGMGNGDIDMGASKMYDLMDQLEQRGQ